MIVFNLDIIPGRANPVIHASQFDVGREYRANLFEGAAVYTLTGAETLTLIVKKPDGNEVTAGVTNTSDSYVDFKTTQQMTACAGSNLCEIRIEEGGDLIGSANFILDCEESPDTGIQSASEIHNLEEQIAEAVADQYDADSVIFDNTPTAGHGIGYAVTSEGIKTALDNLDLDDLSDVTITSAQTGEAVVWDGSKWVNGTVSTVGSIDDLNDVDTTGKVDGASLVYNSGDTEWKAKKLTVSLTQAEYDALALSGDLVEGTTYIITDGQDVTCDLDDLNDVSVSASPNGKYLKNVSGTWKDVTPSYNDLANKPKIQTGFEIGTKDSDGVRTVVFAEPFNTVSAVTVTPVYTTMPSAGEYIRACTVLAISTTQFQYVEVARKSDGTYYTPAQTTDKCFYIAVGT